MKVKPASEEEEIDVSLLDALLEEDSVDANNQAPFIFGGRNEFEFNYNQPPHPVYLTSSNPSPQIVYLNSPGPSTSTDIPMSVSGVSPESTREVIRERLVRKFQTQGDPYASITDNKSQSPKPSKNAEQARRNRLRKKEEENREKEEIKKARQTLNDLDHRNNQLKSDIMANIQEQQRLEEAIKNDTILGELVTFTPKQTSTMDVSNYMPDSGGICLSLNGSSPAINLCLECSRRYSALNDLTKKEEAASLEMTRGDTNMPRISELSEPSDELMSL